MGRSRGSALWLLVLVSLVGCGSEVNTGPGDAVELFYTHLNDGNYKGAIGLYDAEARGVLDDPNAAEDGAFAQWAKLETKDGQIDRVSVVDREEVEEGKARIRYEIRYTDGSTAERSVAMTLEGGDWKLGLIG